MCIRDSLHSYITTLKNYQCYKPSTNDTKKFYYSGVSSFLRKRYINMKKFIFRQSGFKILESLQKTLYLSES